MPTLIRLLEIDSPDDARRALQRVRVGPDAYTRLAPKLIPLRIALGPVPPAAANILKQEMLAAGGDAAVTEGAAACRDAETEVLLTGSRAQINRLVRALRGQPFGLDPLGVRLSAFISEIDRREFTVKTRAGELEFGRRTLVMAVLNVTPDSFSDGGKYLDPASAVDHGRRLVEEGADVIDVGGESTRPGAAPVEARVEAARVLPVIERLAGELGVPVSIDTMKSRVAEDALRAGASMVNVVGALEVDPAVADAAARAEAGLVLMHMKGRPAGMAAGARYPAGVMAEVIGRLSDAIAAAEARGVDRERIILDPGIGFGKRAVHSLEVLRRLGELRSLGRPILVGPSRKSFIGDVTGQPVPERFAGTAAACAVAVMNGAMMVRVHEVAPVLPALRIAEAVRDAAGEA